MWVKGEERRRRARMDPEGLRRRGRSMSICQKMDS